MSINAPHTAEVLLKDIDGLGDIRVIERQARRVTCGLVIVVVIFQLLLAFNILQHVLVDAGHIEERPLDTFVVHAKESK